MLEKELKKVRSRLKKQGLSQVKASKLENGSIKIKWQG